MLCHPRSLLQTHCETVAAALAPVEGTDMPVLYYHFPGVYNDDFELLPLLSTLVEVCPNVVGAKLAGVGDMKVRDCCRCGGRLQSNHTESFALASTIC